MMTFLIERTIPPNFHFEDSTEVARHCRWAVDAYRKVGAFWLGGAVTDDGMFGLVTAEQADDLRRYQQSLGIADDDFTLRRILQPLGPYFAAPRS